MHAFTAPNQPTSPPFNQTKPISHPHNLSFFLHELKKKMPGTGPRAKHWMFTMNNYTPADLYRLSAPIPGVDYLIFGKEVGASGTPHLQGSVCFQSRKRLQQVKAIIGDAHCTVARHLLQSIEYCKKDGDFTEVGSIPDNQPRAPPTTTPKKRPYPRKTSQWAFTLYRFNDADIYRLSRLPTNIVRYITFATTKTTRPKLNGYVKLVNPHAARSF